MLKFSNKVSLHVCARTEEQRLRWVSLFTRLMQCLNQVDSKGVWQGPKVSESEPDHILTVWFADTEWSKLARILKYAQWYHQAAAQEAVSLEFVAHGLWFARVVFGGEWGELVEEVHCAYDPKYREEREGEALCRYFEERVLPARLVAQGLQPDGSSEFDPREEEDDWQEPEYGTDEYEDMLNARYPDSEE